MNQNQIKLSGKAAQALWDAGRRDVKSPPSPSFTSRPKGNLAPYTLATDEPLTTPQAIAVGGVSPLVEVETPSGARYRLASDGWEVWIHDRWSPAVNFPGSEYNTCKAWRLVAGDVREEREPAVGWDRAALLLSELLLDDGVLAVIGDEDKEALYTAIAALSVPHRPHTLTLPHRTDSLAEAGRHAEGGGVVEDSDGDLCRIRDGQWEGTDGSGIWTPGYSIALGEYMLHPADYRDDAATEPEPVKPKRGAELRRWAIDHAPRVVLVDGRHRQRWSEAAARFEAFEDGGWEQCDIGDDDEGMPESGTWESERGEP